MNSLYLVTTQSNGNPWDYLLILSGYISIMCYTYIDDIIVIRQSSMGSVWNEQFVIGAMGQDY